MVDAGWRGVCDSPPTSAPVAVQDASGEGRDHVVQGSKVSAISPGGALLIISARARSGEM